MHNRNEHYIIQAIHKDYPNRLYRIDVHVNCFNQIWSELKKQEVKTEHLVILRVDRFFERGRPAIYDYYGVFKQILMFGIRDNWISDRIFKGKKKR